MREQREVIYAQRQEVIMEENDLSDVLMGMVKRTIGRVVDSHTQLEKEEWNLDGIVDFAASTLVHEDTISKKDLENKSAEEIKDYLVARAQEVFEEKSQQLNGQEQLLEFEKLSSCVSSILNGQITLMQWINYANLSAYVRTVKTTH